MFTAAQTPAEALTARQARAELSLMVEPPDPVAAALIDAVGPVAAYELASSHAAADQDTIDTVTTTAHGQPPITADQLLACLDRLRLRHLSAPEPVRLDVMDAMGITLLTPEDPQWPITLSHAMTPSPVALWCYTTGTDDPAARFANITTPVSITGTRDLSDYGAKTTTSITTELIDLGHTIVVSSGYGTASAAMRAGLAAENPHAVTPLVTVLPSGPDRLHPAGASPLLSEVAHAGLIISEYGPGHAATRRRTVRTNALAAQLSKALVVTEGRLHSSSSVHGAVAAADTLSLPVAAVPGSIYSPTSELPNALLNDPQITSATGAGAVRRMLAHY